MAMQTNVGRARGRMVADINVTPFVDVMLVLLIIFMVAAPLMLQGIDVKLPATTTQATPVTTERLVVTISRDRRVFINEDTVDLETLSPRIAALYQASQDKCGVILRADESIDYGMVVQVMGAIRKGGIDQIGMVTELRPDEGPTDHSR